MVINKRNFSISGFNVFNSGIMAGYMVGIHNCFGDNSNINRGLSIFENRAQVIGGGTGNE